MDREAIAAAGYDDEVEVEAEVTVDLPDRATRIGWFEDWEETTQSANELARNDRDYYDNKQWSQEDLDKLRERGQPPLVKNRIARKVNFILGEEIEKRVDPVAKPRTAQHEDGARAMTDALRYVEEQQRFDAARSAVAKNMLIEGFGGAIKGIERKGDGIKHTLKHVQWDRLFYDPHSREHDFSDAKFLGIVLWMDLDDAKLAYPDSADDLEAALTSDIGDYGGQTDDAPRRWSDRKRKRVKVVEMYFRLGEDWYRSDFTQGADLLPPEPTAYKNESGEHTVCPLVMASCYIDQEGMRYGVVRQLISPQDEINKRASKALHLLSVRQVIAERDFIRDPQKFQAELAKPDGYAEVEPGGLTEHRVEVTSTGDLAQGHVAMMQQAIQDLDNIGPSAASIPELPSGASGVAFQRRQKAASQEMGSFFDSLRDWTHSVYKLDYLCIRQYWTEETWLRVSDDEEMTGYRFVALNRRVTRAARMQELLKQGVPPPTALVTAAGEFARVVMRDVTQQQQMLAAQAQQQQAMMQQAGRPGQPPPKQDPMQLILSHPLMAEEMTDNQVEKMLMDIVVDDAPETGVLAEEEFQKLTEMLPAIAQGRPDMMPEMIKLIVKASSLPNRRELLKVLDKGPDPQQQQMQQAAQQTALQQGAADVQVAQTQAQLNAAKAEQAKVAAQVEGPKAKAEIEAKTAASMVDAANAGDKVGGMMGGMGGGQGGMMNGMMGGMNNGGAMPRGAM